MAITPSDAEPVDFFAAMALASSIFNFILKSGLKLPVFFLIVTGIFFSGNTGNIYQKGIL
jgi:hypothetical protein